MQAWKTTLPSLPGTQGAEESRERAIGDAQQGQLPTARYPLAGEVPLPQPIRNQAPRLP